MPVALILQIWKLGIEITGRIIGFRFAVMKGCVIARAYFLGTVFEF